MNMKLLVTGGLGFIGSNFIRYILSNYSDVEVINVDALKYGSNPNNLKDVENDDRYTFVKGDISDYDLISNLIKNVYAIVNFAAETHVDRSISNPYSFLQSNVVGVFTILEAMRKCNPNAKLVHISTDEVYGDILQGSFKEDDTLRPSSPYSASKAAADMFVLSYARTYGLHAMITRCTNNYGAYQFPEKLIPKTIIRAAMNMKIPIYGTGKNVRDWIYVLDHCEAINTVMQKGKKGEIYNISSGEEKTNLEVVTRILSIMGKDEDLIEFVEDRPGHDIRYSLDSSKIRNELGWKPKHSFEEGIKETVNWYLENEWWWKPLADERVLHPTPWKLKW
ncbi:dTDP-glucose 4,6-dehydratase [Archaeoglobus veneficus SNP6]|uniref:dTDP-glucose 4,6-dehydratase n=2 Tax=Archaeoglobus veneficus TaxID=58290 RepID=F2KQD6_ARCVS|nr:dTDP-glucose 4,6-dehydratase [Archaeoglobus veneficus SNP6]